MVDLLGKAEIQAHWQRAGQGAGILGTLASFRAE